MALAVYGETIDDSCLSGNVHFIVFLFVVCFVGFVAVLVLVVVIV